MDMSVNYKDYDFVQLCFD